MVNKNFFNDAFRKKKKKILVKHLGSMIQFFDEVTFGEAKKKNKKIVE